MLSSFQFLTIKHSVREQGALYLPCCIKDSASRNTLSHRAVMDIAVHLRVFRSSEDT